MNLLLKLYYLLTAPIYNRLLWELRSGQQALFQTQLDSQAHLLEQVLDELSSINLRLDEFKASPSELSDFLKQRDQRLAEIEDKLSSETICSMITELQNKGGMQSVLQKYEISASAAVLLDCKYHGMNAFGIERIRQTAKQSQMLDEQLSRLQAYQATSAPL